MKTSTTPLVRGSRTPASSPVASPGLGAGPSIELHLARAEGALLRARSLRAAGLLRCAAVEAREAAAAASSAWAALNEVAHA